MSETKKAQSEDQGIGHVLDLDTNALVGLTQKIQDNLKKPLPSISHQLRSTRKPTLKKARANIETGNRSSLVSPSTKQHHGENSRNSSVAAQNLNFVGHSLKKLRDGKAKASKVAQNARSDVNKSRLGVRTIDRLAGGKTGLENDVLALGGDAEDLELLTGAGSESEVDGDNGRGLEPQKKKFQHDFQDFFQELGIDQAVRQESQHEDKDADHGMKYEDSIGNLSTGSLRRPSRDQRDGHKKIPLTFDAKSKAVGQLVSASIL